MSTYIIKNPTDIFSLIMNVYGTLEEGMKFISDNSAVLNTINSDISTLAGYAVYYDSSMVVSLLTPKSVLSTPAIPVTEYNWIGCSGQNMFDVCLQTYGKLEEQIKLMNDNNVDLSTTIFGYPFTYDSTLIANSSIWNRTTASGVVFSTGN